MVKAIETMIDVLDGTLQLNGMRFLIEKAKGLNLNVRLQKILLHFLDVNRSSVEEIRKERNLVRRTVQRDLSKLLTFGLIKENAKSKSDPTKYYELL